MESGDPGEVFFIHFDLPRHELPLEVFVACATSTADIARAINREWFGGVLEYRFLVLPPEDGTFLAKIGIVAGLVAGGILGGVGEGLVEGLTGKTPAAWTKEFVEGLREDVAEMLDPDVGQDARCAAGARATADAVRWLLESSPDTLLAAEVDASQMSDALVARNHFYEACETVPDLAAVGFDEKPEFPIPRNQFRLMRVPVPDEEEEDDATWYVEVVWLKVTSPNWDRSDSGRRWKGTDGEGNTRVFHILDEIFWGKLFREELKTHPNDTMKVQWAYQKSAKGPTNFKVLSVLEFNGAHVSEPRSDDQIKMTIAKFVKVVPSQKSLFEEG